MAKNRTAEEVVRILKEYSEVMQVPKRSTSDLSPLEEWLIIYKIIEKGKNND